jgi:hypothetical protein
MAYRLLEEEKSDKNIPKQIGQELVRTPARTASNLVTRGIGLPGDVLSLVNELAARPITKALTGKKTLPYEETFLGKAIPTTQTHRKGIESVTGDFLKPKNKIEEFTDNLIEDTALMLIPGGKLGKAQEGLSKVQQLIKQVPSSFFKSLGANLTGEVAKQFSGDREDVGNLAKVGAFFALSLFDKGRSTKYISDLYQQAEKNLPKNATTSAENLSKNLETLENSITKARPVENLADSEKFVLNSIDKTRSLIKDGKINIGQAWAQKRSFNEELTKKLYEIPGKEGQHRARKLAKQVNHWLNNVIENYGEKNPEFYKPYKNAEEGFGTIAQSNFISRFIENNLKYSPLTAGLLHIFGAPIGAAAAKSVIPYQVGKIGYRIWNSPTLRNHYLNAVKAASKENISIFTKELKKLDEKLQEEENVPKYRFLGYEN